jgi:hypothetical protein
MGEQIMPSFEGIAAAEKAEPTCADLAAATEDE